MTMRVVSAVIICEGRILLTQRRAQQSYPFKWETPGGKVEPTDANDHMALDRELLEELGLATRAIEFVTEVDIEDPPRHVVFYRALLISFNAYAKEGQSMGWFDRREFGQLLVDGKLLPGNEKAFAKLAEQLR